MRIGMMIQFTLREDCGLICEDWSDTPWNTTMPPFAPVLVRLVPGASRRSSLYLEKRH
jgi:hypothetical protein